MSTQSLPHSAQYFGDHRDLWWNYDFLELMARRWNLKSIRTVLDVGCGVGHWGLTLLPFLDNNTQIQGIDPESIWIEKAKQRMIEKGVSNQFNFQIGNAEQIPFADNSFDMVTCQTVLIHVADVNVALKEMVRVLKPGGLMALAEPNNLAPLLTFNNLSIDEPIDNLLEYIRFQITCERGKKAMGLGYNSVGDVLPLALSKQNLQEIQVYLSDKTSLMIPPYHSKEEQILIKQINEWENEEVLVWSKDETKRYFLSGGGTKHEFEQKWSQMIKDSKENIEAINNRIFSSINTTIMYLISGRKK